jgi:hypothetical protein
MALRRPAGRRLLPAAAAFLVAFAVYFAAEDHMGQLTVGDEPHYVLEAHSLAEDGDRDLADEYRDRALWSKFFTFPVLSPDLQAFDYTGHGLISVHNIGLPALVAPAAALSDKVRPIRIELVLIAAFAAAMLLGLLRDLRLAGPVWTAVVWAFVAFSAPLTMFAGEVYPEVAAAALMLVGVRAALRGPASRGWLAAGSLAAAAMPWLHVRFTLLAVGIVAAIALRCWPARRDTGWGPVALAVAPLLVSLAVMAIAFQAWYGSPLLNAQYGGPVPEGFASHTDRRFLYGVGLGQLLSPEFGLLPVTPVAILALAAIPLTWRRYGWWGAYATAVAAAYAAVCFTGNTGTAFPARFLVVLLPLAAVPLLVAVADAPVVRPVLVLLGLAGFAFALDGVYHPGEWYNLNDGLIDTPLGRRTHAAWPRMLSAPSESDRYPGGALAAVWLAWIAFAAALLYAARRPRTQHRAPRAV